MPSATDLPPRSAAYTRRNLLDRVSSQSAHERHYRQMRRREREILDRCCAIHDGRVLSVGCGWHPGRHLFPAPAFHLVGVDSDPERVASVIERGEADEAFVAAAGKLPLPPASFEVILYRLVLHHLAYQGPLEPVFEEAATLLAPGGALVVIEPGLWHPVGVGLAIANRLGVASALHGAPDDVPLSPRRLVDSARAVGLEPRLHAVTFSWRRLPGVAQAALERIDEQGSRPRLAPLGHTLMMVASKRGLGAQRS